MDRSGHSLDTHAAEDTKTSSIILYDHPLSPCARRVRITLIEKGLSWETQNIDLSRLEQRSPRYLAINPNGLVPTLAHGCHVLWESNVITEYLDRAFPDTIQLYPTIGSQRIEVKFWQNAELLMAETFRPLMYQRLMGPIVHSTRTHEEAMRIARLSTDDPADLEWEDKVWRVAVLTPEEQLVSENTLYEFADRVESELKKSTSGWLVGNAFSQAEISVYPRLLMYPWIGLPLELARFPCTIKWMSRLAERQSFTQSLSADLQKTAQFLQSPVFALLRRVTLKPVEKRWFFERFYVNILGMAIRWVGDSNRVGVTTLQTPMKTAPNVSMCTPRHPTALEMDKAVKLVVTKDSPDSELIIVALKIRKIDYSVEESTPAPRLEIAGKVIEDAGLALDAINLVSAPGPRLFPDNIVDDARVRIWLAFAASWHKEFYPLLKAMIVDQTSIRDDSRLQTAVHILGNRLDQLESRLNGREWVATNDYTIADEALKIKIEMLPRMDVQVDSRLNITTWMQRCATIKSASI
jgi:glutathione S-transferase